MKLKGKLILSCAALAAVATTAFSTTYAWYTSNTEVNAKGLKASTEGASNSALQISLDGKTEWGASVDLAAITKNLTPVQRDEKANSVSEFTTQNINGTTNPVTQKNVGTEQAPEYEDAKDADKAKNIVQFNLYFRNVTMGADKKCEVFVKAASIFNQMAGGVATKTLADISTDYTLAKYSTYKVDILRALDVEIVAFDSEVISTDNIDMTDTLEKSLTYEKLGNYNLETYANKKADGTDTSDSLTALTAGSWDALTYYNKVKGLYGYYKAVGTAAYSATETYYTRSGAGTTESPYVFTATFVENATDFAAKKANLFLFDKTIANPDLIASRGKRVEPATGFDTIVNDDTKAIGTIQSETQILKTTWTLYLDGWDTACYDACKGQTVSFDFTFAANLKNKS